MGVFAAILGTLRRMDCSRLPFGTWVPSRGRGSLQSQAVAGNETGQQWGKQRDVGGRGFSMLAGSRQGYPSFWDHKRWVAAQRLIRHARDEGSEGHHAWIPSGPPRATSAGPPPLACLAAFETSDRSPHPPATSRARPTMTALRGLRLKTTPTASTHRKWSFLSG
jgi:hypothetical protein